MKQYWILGKGWIGLSLAAALVLAATFALAGPGGGSQRESQFGPGGPQAIPEPGAQGGAKGQAGGGKHHGGRKGKEGREAKAGRGESGEGKGREGGMGAERGRVLFGTLSAASDSSWTITPQIPPKLRERAEEKGRELPELPASISFGVGTETKYYINSAEGQGADFKTGDELVIKLDKPWKEEGAQAQAVADPQTAREFIMKKMGDRGERGERDKGGERGAGGPGGERGEGHRGKRPGFGTVSAISADSITITPEVPAFIADKAKEMGHELPDLSEMPSSITVALDSSTKYFQNSAAATANPFKVGDKVAVLAKGDKENRTALVVSDYSSAEARMKERMERGGPEGEGRGEGRGEHGKHGKGKRAAEGEGKCEGQNKADG